MSQTGVAPIRSSIHLAPFARTHSYPLPRLHSSHTPLINKPTPHMSPQLAPYPQLTFDAGRQSMSLQPSSVVTSTTHLSHSSHSFSHLDNPQRASTSGTLPLVDSPTSSEAITRATTSPPAYSLQRPTLRLPSISRSGPQRRARSQRLKKQSGQSTSQQGRGIPLVRVVGSHPSRSALMHPDWLPSRPILDI